MKIHLISFAAALTNNNPIYKALDRIAKQADKIGWFDSFIGYTDRELKQDINFWQKHKDFILNNKKGYGYMLWKPYIIDKHFYNLDENDILLYIDAGCEIYQKETVQKINKNNFIDDIYSRKLLGCGQSIDHHVKHYTKNICYDFFNIKKQDLIQNKVYLETNRLAFIKDKTNISIIKDWWNIMDNHYELYDLSTPIKNDDTFIDSRHDQMIFNFILYQNNRLNIENLFPDYYKSIFYAPRNKGGISFFCREAYKKDKSCICGCCVP